VGTESLVGWDLLTQSGNMAKDCDATASNLQYTFTKYNIQ